MFRGQRPIVVRAYALVVCVLLGSCSQTGGMGRLGAADTADVLRSHVEVLASDAFTGRETGTEGFERAAEYVTTSFVDAGLIPADGSFRQTIPLYSVDRSSVSGTFALTTDGVTRQLEMNEDVSYFPPLTRLDTDDALEASGELVFVGSGLSAPSLGFDDYSGVDVAGKIVVVLSGTPPITDAAARFHLQRLDTKRMEAAERGAAAIIFADPAPRSVSRLTRLRRQGRHGALVVETTPEQAIPAAAISFDTLSGLIDAAGRDTDTVIESARNGSGESFSLGATAELSVTASATRVDAFNVVGVLPGQDPTLADEAVVVTAHLDHLGTRHPGFLARSDEDELDHIFNGALDNGLGVAIVMEAAGRLSKDGGTARALIFAAVTAEEAGLLGSQHLAESIEGLGYQPVANINIDMPIMTYPFTDIIGFGVEYSSIKAPLDAAAARVGVVATPDPVPSMSLFVRSDHYRFVQRGVPSVFLFNGMSGNGREGFDAFMDEHYHQPSDQADLPIRWQDAARFADLSVDLIRRIADAPEPPTWNEGAVFAP
ncbi:MAG: M28 family peptidase [Pseudomonadota bacterium]